MLRLASVAVVALVFAMGVVACGGDDDTEAGIPSGVTAALEAFNDATNSYDTEALLAITTEDFTWQSTGEVQTRAEYLAYFEANYEAVKFHSDDTGEPLIEPDGDAYIVTGPDHVTALGMDTEGLHVMRLVEIDGTWLVQEMRWHGTTTETDG